MGEEWSVERQGWVMERFRDTIGVKGEYGKVEGVGVMNGTDIRMEVREMYICLTLWVS